MKSLSIIPDETKSDQSSGCGVSITAAGDAPHQGAFGGTAAVVTLGCAKNQVDSEVMLGALGEAGFEIVSDISEADVVIVNTCGFLESAVRESIDAVLEAAEYKEKGRLRRLIVAGCAVERYRNELEESLPEVDQFLLTSELLSVGKVARDGVMERALKDAGRPYFLYDETMPRRLASAPHTAYVKIAEGCNRPCTFCIIPRIRGAMRSRSIASVAEEIRSLGARGVREVNLVAQDLTSYGTDASPKESLVGLLETLDRDGAVPWIRLLYSYPIGIDTALLRAIAELPSVCEYLDLPLQHASESVLRAMKRPLGSFATRPLVERIRATAPELALRTTFIVGFPGETEEDVAELEKLVREEHFSSVGVFTYSRERGTPSHDYEGQVPERAKEERRKRIMTAQQEVVAKRLEQQLGKRFSVLLEGTHHDTDLLLTGRARWQAPEVDGTIIINDIEPLGGRSVQAGDLVTVEITEVAGYDLVGAAVAVEAQR
jgi:ribosomal protein S12 methylthiotransferase